MTSVKEESAPVVRQNKNCEDHLQDDFNRQGDHLELSPVFGVG